MTKAYGMFATSMGQVSVEDFRVKVRSRRKVTKERARDFYRVQKNYDGEGNTTTKFYGHATMNIFSVFGGEAIFCDIQVGVQRGPYKRPNIGVGGQGAIDRGGAFRRGGFLVQDGLRGVENCTIHEFFTRKRCIEFQGPIVLATKFKGTRVFLKFGFPRSRKKFCGNSLSLVLSGVTLYTGLLRNASSDSPTSVMGVNGLQLEESFFSKLVDAIFSLLNSSVRGLLMGQLSQVFVWRRGVLSRIIRGECFAVIQVCLSDGKRASTIHRGKR